MLDPRREGDVTASDVAAICGECAFQNRRSVLYKKALKLRGEDTPATLHGRTLEPTALRRFVEETGATVLEYPCEYKKHPIYNWFGGTRDAVVKTVSGDVVVVEIKCPISRPIKDEVPMHYVGQVQSYLALAPEMPYALFVQYKPAGPRSKEKLQITRVNRDPRYMDVRLPSLKRFWDELQLWSAYVERVVVVIQRAWRYHRSKAAAAEAAKNCMVARLRCANLVGKLAGFCRKRDVSRGMLVPPPFAETGYSIIDDDTDARPAFQAMPPQARRPKHSSNIYVM